MSDTKVRYHKLPPLGNILIFNMRGKNVLNKNMLEFDGKTVKTNQSRL